MKWQGEEKLSWNAADGTHEQTPSMQRKEAKHEPSVGLETLPDEVLLLICSLLSPSAWCTLMTVNKRFNDLAADNSLWELIIPPKWKAESVNIISPPNDRLATDQIVNWWKGEDKSKLPFLRQCITAKKTISWRKAFLLWAKTESEYLLRLQTDSLPFPLWIKDAATFNIAPNSALPLGVIRSSRQGYGKPSFFCTSIHQHLLRSLDKRCNQRIAWKREIEFCASPLSKPSLQRGVYPYNWPRV